VSGLLGTIDTVFWGILTFSILVVLHEMGHFLAARAFGIKVHEFMVGLPGPAVRLRTKNMAWGVTAIPLGGYVRIAGMEPGKEDDRLATALSAFASAGRLDAAGLASRLGLDLSHAEALTATLADWKAIEQLDDESEQYSLADDLSPHVAEDAEVLLGHARSMTYRGKPRWQRITVLAMGVLVNLLTAILTFTLVLSIWGYFEPSLTIDSVGEGTPAEAAGIRAGDTLVSFGDTQLADWEGFQAALADTEAGDGVIIVLDRGGSRVEVDLTLADRDGHGYVGVAPSLAEVDLSVGESLTRSIDLTGLVFAAIADFFSPSSFPASVEQVTGVIGISVLAADAARAGPLEYAWLIALLSLSLGAMNIIPLPPLDGGKIVLELVEGVIRRPLDRRLTLGMTVAGAAVLFALIGYIMYADIVRFAM
jgi:regulator of sigma E protease